MEFSFRIKGPKMFTSSFSCSNGLQELEAKDGWEGQEGEKRNSPSNAGGMQPQNLTDTLKNLRDF
jgi:hypothetical protein